MTSRAWLCALSALFHAGCFSSTTIDEPRPDGGRLSADGSPPIVEDGGPVVVVGDPTLCSAAPRLGLDARIERVDPAGAMSPAPDPASCWLGTPGPRLYHRLEVPARTGVEIRTRGTNAPVPGLVDRCAPEGDRCRSFGPSGLLAGGEAERVHYFGNPEDAPRTLILHTWWVDGEVAPFSLETRSFELAPHARCEAAQALPLGELLPPSSARGSTYESWDCTYLDESQFYTLVVPPRSAAVELDGSQLLRARPACECRDFVEEDLLVNLTNEPRRVLIEASPLEPIGARVEELARTAQCETAVTLVPDGPVVSLASYPRALRSEAACAPASAGVGAPTWLRVDVYPGETVEVVAQIDTPYPQLVAFTACGEGCEAAELRDDGSLVLRFTNEDESPFSRRFVLAGDGFPGAAAIGSGTIRAHRLP